MKTIVAGNFENTREYKYFECLNCGWVGKADKIEYTYCGDQREGDCWGVRCPYCGYRAYNIQQCNRLNQIVDKEIKMQQKESNYWENR